MRAQRGASVLFIILLVALAGVVLWWFVSPYYEQRRTEKIEKDLSRGVAPSSSVHPSTAEARERAQNTEFAEAHGGLKSLVGTDHYRALSPRCRELIDTYVAILDQPADSATDQPARRAAVAEIQRTFEAECVN